MKENSFTQGGEEFFKATLDAATLLTQILVREFHGFNRAKPSYPFSELLEYDGVRRHKHVMERIRQCYQPDAEAPYHQWGMFDGISRAANRFFISRDEEKALSPEAIENAIYLSSLLRMVGRDLLPLGTAEPMDIASAVKYLRTDPGVLSVTDISMVMQCYLAPIFENAVETLLAANPDATAQWRARVEADAQETAVRDVQKRLMQSPQLISDSVLPPLYMAQAIYRQGQGERPMLDAELALAEAEDNRRLAKHMTRPIRAVREHPRVSAAAADSGEMER